MLITTNFGILKSIGSFIQFGLNFRLCNSCEAGFSQISRRLLNTFPGRTKYLLKTN